MKRYPVYKDSGIERIGASDTCMAMANQFCRHCRQNWFRNSVVGLVSEIYQGWFVLLRFFICCPPKEDHS